MPPFHPNLPPPNTKRQQLENHSKPRASHIPAIIGVWVAREVLDGEGISREDAGADEEADQ
jgi:hypothetical protein